jgi:hypothetical protein
MRVARWPADVTILASSPAHAPRIADQDLSDPTFEQVIDASLEHDRQIGKKEAAWLEHEHRPK